MSEIIKVSLASIDPNPMRQLKTYPFNEKKVETLMRSIADVGLWEGVIGRKQANRIQLAFGHHRVEACKRELGKDARISVIVRELTDEQMIQFMGRENMEDYNADFMVMLESWEAATNFLSAGPRQKPETIDVAGLLGWTQSNKGHLASSHTARACNDALRLMQGGYLNKQALEGLSVDAVQQICGRVVAQHEMLDKMAKTTGRPEKEIDNAKKVSGKAGEKTARDVKAGRVAHRDIRGSVDTHAYRHARAAKQQSPLFELFGKSLIEQIRRCGQDDSIGEKLREVKKALSHITDKKDVEVVKNIAFQCEVVSERFVDWQKVFANSKTKVVPLKAIAKQ